MREPIPERVNSSRLPRREFLKTAAGAVLAARIWPAPAANAPVRKAPFRTLYGNDTTQLLTCTSPWHRSGEAFRKEMLEASIDEVDVDAHLLQPGLGCVPWWPSKVCPLAEHVQWLKKTFAIGPDALTRFVLEGGDLVEIFVVRCRQRGQSPLISFRLNDGHHKEFAAPGQTVPSSAGKALSQFYCEHPQYRIGPDPKNWNQRVLNWAISEVREYTFALLQELAENYDLDGLELDFMRHPSFFRLEETNSTQRSQIMSQFVRRVRGLLDRTERAGRHRWLSVRIPAHLGAHEGMGIDVESFAGAGAEIFNLSAYYFLEQQTDAAAIRNLLPEAFVYLELTPATYAGPALNQGGGNDNFSFRRTTKEQFSAAAHLAFHRKLDGVSLYNFQYYREHGAAARGPFCEPPFEILPSLREPSQLARQAQHWFLAHVWDEPFVPNRPMGNKRRPRVLQSASPVSLEIDLAAPEGGWRKNGRLRIQTLHPFAEAKVLARFNGLELVASARIDEPYPNPHPALLGDATTLLAWLVPADLPKNGSNQLEFTLVEGPQIALIFVDLAL